MAPDPQQIVSLLESALTASDPTTALGSLTALRTQLDALERVQVTRALESGQTFSAIAKPLGISRQAAHRRYRDINASPPPRRPPTLSAEARATLIRAREEAARHGSRSIDSEHLLLALARSSQLQRLGLDVEAARRSFAPPAINAASPAGFRPSLHALLARDDGPIGVDHLLRAALEDPAGGALRLLDRLGIQPQALLDAL
jgi:ATP-dependent Clp protease ATP-binding subunit ClpA